jgi:outer membrane cobalamin receptor
MGVKIVARQLGPAPASATCEKRNAVRASFRSTLRLPSTHQAAGNSVVVSPTTQPTPSDQSARVTVITADQIESQQFRTVLNALATVCGLNVVQRGQTSIFHPRHQLNQVEVLIDGIETRGHLLSRLGCR